MIKYVNQGRLLKAGAPLDEWSDVCSGHNSFYAAQTCALAQETMLANKPVDEKLASVPIRQFMALMGKCLADDGMALETRIIKRTTSEEVLDA